MDDKKKSPPAPAAAAAATAPAPANGYFSSVFSASPAANPRDARETDLNTILNRQNPKGPTSGGIADGKFQGSPTKGRVTYKDGQQFYPNEPSESPYFGSSVHYGGRDFYDSSPHKQASESSRSYKDDNPDGSLATRGDWWQGSLYY
ncbi:hypothetical protein BRADI_2g23540v3 [Brachypodium distachyon]|uniref:Uncharacterized protein n=2 Tax=Brachypodium distachyon TaxID=15368 RepID=I1HIU8_BRADI|nr:hypothetical protein BRADI_2g23540v3 [Brachypodium distachyon]KQK05952.1 hypothetical protein BRADI_2g23540v3 [Brachypodium distachyon]